MRRLIVLLAVVLVVGACVTLCSTDILMTPAERNYRARGMQ